MYKTSQVGVLLPFLTLPPPDTFSSSVPLPWSAYLGLLLPLPLTALLLSILSHLSPYQVRYCVTMAEILIQILVEGVHPHLGRFSLDSYICSSSQLARDKDQGENLSVSICTFTVNCYRPHP